VPHTGEVFSVRPPMLPTLLASLALQQPFTPTRRAALIGIGSATVLPVGRVLAEETPRVLTDEEMAARVARKMELIRQQDKGARAASPSGVSGVPPRPGLDSYSVTDFNPEAGANLRAKSFTENAKAALAKQEELKKRDKKQKRDDLCEMLGRGC
jgi:hypothetical protein